MGILLILSLLLLCLPGLSTAVPSGKVLTWEGGGQGTVRFEGKEHAEKGYRCDACHPGLFQMKKGSAAMTMEEMNKGRFCGVCHNGSTAFSTKNPGKCRECHRGAGRGKGHEGREDHRRKREGHHD